MMNYQRIKVLSHLSIQSSQSGKGFVFDHRTGYVYLVNKTGIYVLQSLKEGKNIEQIVDSLSVQFELDRKTLLRDIQEFLESLLSEGLLVAEE